jgi:heavy metal sensor kinase
VNRIPIRLRLTGWFVLVLAAVLLALSAFVVSRLRADLTAEVDRSLMVTAAKISQGYREEGAAEFVDATREAVAASGSRTLGAQLLDEEGRVIRFSGSDLMRLPLIGAEASARLRGSATQSLRRGPEETHVRVLVLPARAAGRREVLVVAEPLAEIDSAVLRTTILLAVGGGISLVLAALGGWWVAYRALRPVERMTTRAAAIGIRALDQRVPVPVAADELAHLAETFNAMLDRLESGVAARERLVADASHELRAPLAAMRAELDVSLRHDELSDDARALLHSLREEATRMARIVDNLLTLARVDDGQLHLLRSPQDLTEIARRAADTYAATAEAAGVDLRVLGDPVPVVVDPDRLAQVIGNLLDNAIRVSRRGATVCMEVSHNGGTARLFVRDEGPGVPEDERDRIFERFARLDPARGRAGGAGLGLAISREIIAGHGGALTLEPATDSVTTFIIELPADPEAPSEAGNRGHPSADV